MAALTTIWWRDIPAQVVAKDTRRASKVVLHPRFQVAIDKAAVHGIIHKNTAARKKSRLALRANKLAVASVAAK